MFLPENDLERALMAAIANPAARPDFYRALLASNVFVADSAMYSSRSRVPEGADVQEMSAPEFLKAAQGRNVLLNPGSTGKEFLAEEIASILDGSIFNFHRKVTVAGGTQILLAQPSRWPAELVEALQRLFGTDKRVKRAWLAHYATGDKPHTLVAIDVDGDFDRIAGEAVAIARFTPVPDPPVDIMQINRGLMSYFRKVKPFYRRKWLGLW